MVNSHVWPLLRSSEGPWRGHAQGRGGGGPPGLHVGAQVGTCWGQVTVDLEVHVIRWPWGWREWTRPLGEDEEQDPQVRT